MKPIVTFFGTQPYEQESFDALNRDFGFEFRYFKGHLSRQTVVATHGAQAACIFVNDTADAEVMRELARNGVRLLALRCAGYNNVDLEAARTFNIPVVRVPAYSPHAVAEYTVAMMLSLNRKIPRASWRTRDGNFSLQGLMGFDMNGKTVGVIGTGKIARIVIRILLGFGMEVLAYDPYPDGVFARETGIAYVSLDELYRRSDIITLHCPLTNETKHLVNETSIARMKRGVMIVNTGRGQLIQTEALIEALKSKQVGAAGLDVYEEEGDYFYEDRSDSIIDDDTLARLLLFPNVIVTSHQAFFTAEAMHNITETTLQNIKDFFDGRPLVNTVTKYRLRRQPARRISRRRCGAQAFIGCRTRLLKSRKAPIPFHYSVLLSIFDNTNISLKLIKSNRTMKKGTRLWGLFALFLLVFYSSCKDDETNDDPLYTLKVQAQRNEIPGDGGDVVFDVTSNGAWSYTIDQQEQWLTEKSKTPNG